VVCAWMRRPGVRADGNFRAVRAACERDGIGRLRIEIIRDEFVEALDAFVNQIELHDIVRVSRLAPNNLKRLTMKRENRTKAMLHVIAHSNSIERTLDEFADNLFDKLVVRVALNHLHQLQSWRSEFDALRRRIIERAVNDVRPVNERVQLRVCKIEARARD